MCSWALGFLHSNCSSLTEPVSLENLHPSKLHFMVVLGGQVGASEKKTEKMEDICHTHGTKKRLVLLLAHTYVHSNIRAAQSHGQNTPSTVDEGARGRGGWRGANPHAMLLGRGT